MARITINRLSSGGVITNYNCVSRCGHCLYNCGPHRSKAYLEPEPAEAIFERIIALGCRSVHIGGGEPLLNPQKLVDVTKAAGKSKFFTAPGEELYRSGSIRPLYITAIGMELKTATAKIKYMHGNYRIPDLLKQVDLIARRKGEIEDGIDAQR